MANKAPKEPYTLEDEKFEVEISNELIEELSKEGFSTEDLKYFKKEGYKYNTKRKTFVTDWEKF